MEKSSLNARAKNLIKEFLLKLDKELLFHPFLRRLIVFLIKTIGIQRALKRLRNKAYVAKINSKTFEIDQSKKGRNVEALSPRAQEIYDDLKKAIEMHNERLS
jgi:hypothetical protein